MSDDIQKIGTEDIEKITHDGDVDFEGHKLGGGDSKLDPKLDPDFEGHRFDGKLDPRFDGKLGEKLSD